MGATASGHHRHPNPGPKHIGAQTAASCQRALAEATCGCSDRLHVQGNRGTSPRQPLPGQLSHMGLLLWGPQPRCPQGADRCQEAGTGPGLPAGWRAEMALTDPRGDARSCACTGCRQTHGRSDRNASSHSACSHGGCRYKRRGAKQHARHTFRAEVVQLGPVVVPEKSRATAKAFHCLPREELQSTVVRREPLLFPEMVFGKPTQRQRQL